VELFWEGNHSQPIQLVKNHPGTSCHPSEEGNFAPALRATPPRKGIYQAEEPSTALKLIGAIKI